MRVAAALIRETNAYDGTGYSLPEDADMYCFLYTSGTAGGSSRSHVSALSGRGSLIKTPGSSSDSSAGPSEKSVTSAENCHALSERRGISSSVRGELAAFGCIYHMNDSSNGTAVAELCAFTSPRYRQRGCFREIMRRLRALPAAADSPMELHFQVYENDASLRVLDRIHAEHEHDELMLSAELHNADQPNAAVQNTAIQDAAVCNADQSCIRITDEDISADSAGTGNLDHSNKFSRTADSPAVIDYEDGSCETRYSRCYFRISEDGRKAYIYGVLTYAQYLRQGHAEQMLKKLFDSFREHGISNAVLQVSSLNAPALRLYDKLGMRETERVSYYVLRMRG